VGYRQHLADGEVDGLVEVGDGVCAPDVGADVFAGDELAGGVSEEAEDFRGLRLQAEAAAVAGDFAGEWIEHEGAKLPEGRRGGGYGHGVTVWCVRRAMLEGARRAVQYTRIFPAGSRGRGERRRRGEP